ncbi:hypothetical protein C8R44DRAFT_745555 [Mycena epipterygia]|nr:hypothetical protein C8R44DRAFT_745555 [Mycena epipterygia]
MSLNSARQPTSSATDGSDMILQVGQTRIYVDKRTLAHHSPIFRSMFSQGINDDPEHMYLVLAALYDPCLNPGILSLHSEVIHAMGSRAFYMETTKSFKLVAAMFRLDNRLEHNFPSPLLEYRELHGQTAGGISVQTHIASYPAFGFDVVNLARTHGLNRILPAAFYIYLTVHFRLHDAQGAISSGITRDDGTVAQLSNEDKTMCLAALGRIITFQEAHAYGFFYRVPGSMLEQCCTSSGNCKPAIISFLMSAVYPLPPVIALTGLNGMKQLLCPGCSKFAHSLYLLGQPYI